MKQNISLKIADRIYSDIEIESEEEEKVRLAVERINKSVRDLVNRYKKVDMQDALSMVLLDEEKKLIALQNKEEVNRILQRLQSLEKRLEEYMVSR